MVLETAWELLERSGIAPASLKGTRTGVFIGSGQPGFGTPHADERAEGYLLTGNTLSVLSGRAAYSLGLEGPAVTVDTACSSSLVAIHLACQSLRQGESSLALAGGATVMVTTGIFTEFSRQRGLAPDARCKSFAQAADGTGWGEGVGLILLERLTDAVRLGHRVWAVVRGSAVNQDGASNGLTAPNGPSQQRVIRAALASASLSATEVDAVEAHGTGTTLGDPIEAEALLATYGQGRPQDRPLWLGSVKSNIGHTQAAAGVAGVIKMVMALRHGVLPATLHVDSPTPHVDWDSGAVRLLTEPVDWPRTGRPRRAGVSSFGISGTNAHIILEQGTPEQGLAGQGLAGQGLAGQGLAGQGLAGQGLAGQGLAGEGLPGQGLAGEAAEAGPVAARAGGPVAPWVVSAKSPQALRDIAGRLVAFMAAEPGATPAEVGWSLAATRSVFEHRAVVLGGDREQLVRGLSALADDEPNDGLVTGHARAHGAGPVFVFPGQGSQWAGMGADLLDTCPVFAARIADCQRALARHVGWDLAAVLREGTGLDRVEVVQPVLWAVMVSLAAVWASYGVVPAAVAGHSQGEIAAACVAGALSLDDAATVVAVRAAALRDLSGRGAMASLGTGPAHAARLIADTTTGTATGGDGTGTG